MGRNADRLAGLLNSKGMARRSSGNSGAKTIVILSAWVGHGYRFRFTLMGSETRLYRLWAAGSHPHAPAMADAGPQSGESS